MTDLIEVIVQRAGKPESQRRFTIHEDHPWLLVDRTEPFKTVHPDTGVEDVRLSSLINVVYSYLASARGRRQDNTHPLIND